MKVTNALEYILEVIVGIMLMFLILLSGFTELTTVRATNYWEHSIYDFEPRDVPHWIAPAPLANFGRESSGGANIVDITGASLDDLDREVAAGNPVIIYTTWLFKPVSYWVGTAPKNLHVTLLTGYNEISGTQRLTDPWTQSDGSQTWDVPRAEIEKIYNETGRRAIVVR